MKRLIRKAAPTNFHYVAKASFDVELQYVCEEIDEFETKTMDKVIENTESPLFNNIEQSAQEKIQDEITNIDVDIASDKKSLVFDIWSKNTMTKDAVKELVENILGDASDFVETLKDVNFEEFFEQSPADTDDEWENKVKEYGRVDIKVYANIEINSISIEEKSAEALSRRRKSIFAEDNSNEKILKILEDSLNKIKQQNVDLDSIKNGAQKIIDEINEMNKK